MSDSTEIPDGEITVACTNFMKILKFMWKKKLGASI